MHQSSFKREKHTLISANLRVINAIFNANRDNMNVTSGNCSPFHANEGVYSRSAQQKVY